MIKPARRGGALAGKFGFFVFASLLMSACAAERESFAPPPPALHNAPYASGSETLLAQDLNAIAPAAFEQISVPFTGDGQTAAYTETYPDSDCSMGDRFDRDMTLAYDFEDGQTRLGLDVDGLSIDSMEVSQVTIEFRYRFEPVKARKERCRYASPVQGLVGSVYNELFVRDRQTIWSELEDRGIDF